MLGIGKYKEQVIVKRSTSVPNGSGGFTTTYAPILTTYAKVTPKTVSNDLIAQGTDLIEAYDIEIRYRQDILITKDDRVEWRGRECEIIGLPPGMINKDYINIIVKTSNTTTDAEV